MLSAATSATDEDEAAVAMDGADCPMVVAQQHQTNVMGDTFLVNNVLSTRQLDLCEAVRQRCVEAREKHSTPFFTNPRFIRETMDGIWIDPEFPQIMFITPESWLFHAMSHFPVCKFSIITTVVLRVYPSELVMELVMLYARFVYLSPCLQHNPHCNQLQSRLDTATRIAEMQRQRPFVVEGFTDISHQLDMTRVQQLAQFYRKSLFRTTAITLFSLLREDRQGKCALHTHEADCYFNSLPHGNKHRSPYAEILKRIDEVCEQEYVRFVTLLDAPLLLSHHVAARRALVTFLTQQNNQVRKITERLRKHQNMDGRPYDVPLVTQEEYASRLLSMLMKQSTAELSSTFLSDTEQQRNDVEAASAEHIAALFPSPPHTTLPPVVAASNSSTTPTVDTQILDRVPNGKVLRVTERTVNRLLPPTTTEEDGTSTESPSSTAIEVAANTDTESSSGTTTQVTTNTNGGGCVIA